MSTVFNASFYLTNNPDVVLAISQGHFSSAQQHFDAFGGPDGSKNDLTQEEKNILTIYKTHRNKNLHKMKNIPIFKHDAK